MRSTNLRLQAAPLSPAFRGTPAEFFAEIVRLLRIVSPDGHYGIVVSDIEPESNQGMWLKDGTKIYVWSDDEARYIPADITDGIATQLTQLADLVSKMAAGRVLFAQLEPGETERQKVIWAQTGESGAVLSVRVWDPAASRWRLLPGTPQYTVSSTGATDDQYVITLDNPASLGQLVGLPVVVRWHRTSTSDITVAVNGIASSAKPLIDSATGAQISAGGVREGQLSEIVYDGTQWQMVSVPADSRTPGMLLITAAGAGTWTVPAGVTRVKATVVGGGGGGAFRGTAWGGGGGGMDSAWFQVTPGEEIPYTVGAGGLRESAWEAGDSTDGADTVFKDTLIARGGRNGGAGNGAGGASVGGSMPLPGADGRWGWISDKASGGISAFPGSLAGFTSFADIGAPLRQPRFGGGGGGDRDSSGNDATDGANGVLLLEW